MHRYHRNNFHFFCHILSCIAETSKHLAKRNIGQFNHTLWPSFAQQNVLDKLNIFLRYHQIKMQKRWNSAFHHWRILIWRYLKNLFSLSKIFLWSKLGQSIQMNCPILFLIRCLLVLAVQDKMLRQWCTRSGRIALFWLSDSQFPYWGSPMWGKFPRNFYYLVVKKKIFFSGRGGSSDHGGRLWHTRQRLLICCLILAGINKNITL